MDNNQIFRIDFDCIHYHLFKISSLTIFWNFFLLCMISFNWTRYIYLLYATTRCTCLWVASAIQDVTWAACVWAVAVLSINFH